MLGTLTSRLFRSGLALLFCLSMAGAALAGPASSAAQENGTGVVPGFGALPPDAELIAWATGEVAEGGAGTLVVERIIVEPGSGLDPLAGPFVILVEQGTLVYEDDLGLEAGLSSGTAQFFAPGDGDSLTNGSDEPAVIVRAALIIDPSIDTDDDESGVSDPDTDSDELDDTGDDSDSTDDNGDDEGDGPGEDTPVQPRDGVSGNAVVTAGLGGVNALILQTLDAPDEVVISLTGNGFIPDEILLLRDGVLVIENAGDDDCEFRIADLDLSLELDAGDIEQVTLDVPAGDYAWDCVTSAGDSLGDGLLTIINPDADPEPDAVESPIAEETPDSDSNGDEAGPNGPAGELLQTAVAFSAGSELFAGAIILQPGGVLTLTEADGSLGVIVSGGNLTVARPGRAPATLRDGRSVTLPSGTSAELNNEGNAPVLVIVAGVTGSSAAEGVEQPDTPEGDTGDPESNDQAPGDLYSLFPDDSELAALGLVPTWVAFTEVTDPGSNTFWFRSPQLAEEILTGADWIQSSEIRYSSEGEETNFGVVTVFGILVDVFEDEEGAETFFEYVQTDPSSEETDFLSGVNGVDGAIELDIGSGSTATMIVAIHSGPYVITLFASGPDLDAQALIYEVAGLIFGVVG